MIVNGFVLHQCHAPPLSLARARVALAMQTDDSIGVVERRVSVSHSLSLLRSMNIAALRAHLVTHFSCSLLPGVRLIGSATAHTLCLVQRPPTAAAP